jgi:uncharacterized membrane protein YccC
MFHAKLTFRMPEYADLLKRIDRLAARADSPPADEALLSEIEDVLAEGYMQALTEEARSRRMASRLEQLVQTLDEPGAAVEARRLAVQRRTLEHQVSTLRSRLNAVREQFIRLGGGHSAAS